MQSKLETVTAWACLLFILVGVVYFVDHAFDKIERATCYKWQSYEAQYPLYETHPDTVQRCITLGVNVHDDY